MSAHMMDIISTTLSPLQLCEDDKVVKVGGIHSNSTKPCIGDKVKRWY